MVPWVLLALGTAVLETLRDLALRKVLRQSGWSTLQVIGLSSALAALLLGLPLLLAAPQPLDGGVFLAALAVGGSLNALAFWGYGRAIALEDLSLVLPLINLSPLVLLLAGWWLLGERPSAAAAAGVGLLVLGALQLGRSSGDGSVARLPGIGRLWGSPGCRWMLLVAALWGVAATMDKLGVQAGGSLLWVLSLQLVIGTTLLSLALPGTRTKGQTSGAGGLAGWRRVMPLLLVAALAGAVGTVWQMEAIRHTAVVHVIAVKRLSTLFGSGIGVVALGEAQGRRRLLAAALMVLGAATVLGSALL